MIKTRNAGVAFSACVAFCIAGAASAAPLGWEVIGNGGFTTPNGVVTTPPAGDDVFYVSTVGGINGVGALEGVGGAGSPTNGSVMTTSLFSGTAGQELSFFFNYVTSDGASFADYAWARLLGPDDTQLALLFTARTTSGGNTVPGFEMPAPEATLDPVDTPILLGTDWSELGGDSGRCWSTGCGHTGWIGSSYTLTSDSDYRLQFGVTNWNDTVYASGMAIANITVDGVPIDPPGVIPLPAAGWLLLGGLGTLAALRRRKHAA